jgi:hypothetical protein
VKDRVGWMRAHSAWMVVRQHGGWINSESAVRGQRRCHGDDGSRDPVGYKSSRSGDVVGRAINHEVSQ